MGDYSTSNVSDSRFVTASEDGTMKFWNVARVGVTRKHIPQFDRSDTPAQNVIAGDEIALSSCLKPKSRSASMQKLVTLGFRKVYGL